MLLVCGRRTIGLSALYRFSTLDFALVFFTVVAAYVEPLAIHPAFHGLSCPEFPCLKRTAVVNLVDQVGAFQFVDLRSPVSGGDGCVPTTAGGVGINPDVPAHNRPLLILGRRLVGA